MDIGWDDVGHVQEAGRYAFRDGTIDLTFAEINTWKKAPETRFQLMRKNPILDQVAYVLGKQV